jgi:hypothetical protein
MARVFVTGSADGLGRAAAQSLLDDGHEVVVHARNEARLAAVRDLIDRGAASVAGDLSDLDETRDVAEQVNRLGRMDAVIHNAAVGTGPAILPVNVVAPYLLTVLPHRPSRLVYLSSSMHRGGRADATCIEKSGHGTTCSYSDSKLFVTTLAVAVAGCGRTCSATRSTPAGSRRGWAGRAHPMTSASGTSPRYGSPPVTIPRRAAPADTGATSGSSPHTPRSTICAFRTNCSPRSHTPRERHSLHHRRHRTSAWHRQHEGIGSRVSYYSSLVSGP